MPNRNNTDIDLLSAYVAALDINGTYPTSVIDTEHRHNIGLRIFFDAIQYGDGVFNIQLFHSDQSGSGFVLIPEDDILTPTTDYPNLSNLSVAGAFLPGKCFPFAQLKTFKRYIRADIIVSGASSGSTVQLLYAFNPEILPTDNDGAEIIVF